MLETADGSLKFFDSNVAATNLKISLADATQPTTERLQNRPKVTTSSQGRVGQPCARIPLSSSCRRALRGALKLRKSSLGKLYEWLEPAVNQITAGLS
eukprot:2890666-Pyramimonas_sp.AAC.1